jgi:hypothetical protein
MSVAAHHSIDGEGNFPDRLLGSSDEEQTETGYWEAESAFLQNSVPDYRVWRWPVYRASIVGNADSKNKSNPVSQDSTYQRILEQTCHSEPVSQIQFSQRPREADRWSVPENHSPWKSQSPRPP